MMLVDKRWIQPWTDSVEGQTVKMMNEQNIEQSVKWNKYQNKQSVK